MRQLAEHGREFAEKVSHQIDSVNGQVDDGAAARLWQRQVLTQPQAIAVTAAFCKRVDAVKLFDAGDVQANGFQVVEDDRPGETYTEAGASYMGFAVSALMASAIAERGRYPDFANSARILSIFIFFRDPSR